MVAIAEALLAVPPHQNGMDAFMDELSKHFVSWKNNPFGGGHRSPGGACMRGVSQLMQGANWREAGGLTDKGNGTAMRSSVVGAYYHRDLEMAWQVGCMTSIPTHNNLESILCAGAVALLCGSAIAGKSWAEAVGDVIHRVENYETTVLEFPKEVKIGSGYSDQNPLHVAGHIAKAFVMAKGGTEDKDFANVNGDDFRTGPATSAAVFFNTRYGTFRNIVTNCVTWTRDSDTTGAIAGAMAGSRFGYGFIPTEWRQGVEQSEYFHKLAARVWEASQTL